MNVKKLLSDSFAQTSGAMGMSRLAFLGDYVFDFTTYDAQASELFAAKALEVCAAISHGSTFEYIKEPESYRWYLLMVNMPFFTDRLSWGTSIRGAWWDNENQTLESCGLWHGDKQVLSMTFTPDEWQAFMAALVAFAKLDDGKTLS